MRAGCPTMRAAWITPGSASATCSTARRSTIRRASIYCITQDAFMYKAGSSERADLPLAVVVGAGGLGMAIARRLGYSHRLLLATRTQATLDKQVAALREEGHDVRSCACDVADARDVAKLAAAVAEHGPMKTLAHVVGLSPSMADSRTIIAVNLVGPAR